ncbi:MAG TPA: phage virion morphogenesis protein [Caulobacteraceae bacterium]|nr:phage virion morphogenesis protein [Caulobacteraceae bacterium]
MAGVTLTLKPTGLKDVEARLAHLAAATHSPNRLMKRIAVVLENSTRQRFRTGIAPDGVPWKPSLRASASGGKTLVLSGRLRDSITSAADDRRAMVGTNLIYGLIHQVGGVIVAKHAKALRFFMKGVGWRQVAKVAIPARPYLGISNRDRDSIADQVRLDIERSLA